MSHSDSVSSHPIASRRAGMTAAQGEQAAAMYSEGHSQWHIARVLGLPRYSVQIGMKRMGVTLRSAREGARAWRDMHGVRANPKSRTGLPAAGAAAALRELLSYDEATGVFTWLVSAGSRKQRKTAGAGQGRGYVDIGINGVNYKAHRLAWLYVHGEWPKAHIDHINRDKGDNRIANLREASPQLNALNQVETSPLWPNKTGYMGVRNSPGGRYRAVLKLGGRVVSLGAFPTPQAAHAAYIAAKAAMGAFQ